jgi:vancomycin resistance protein YoaR
MPDPTDRAAGIRASGRYATHVSAATERIPYRVYPGRQRFRFRHALILLAAAIGLVLIGLAAQAYNTRNVIVPGVSVAGVDVGGLTPEQARAKVIAKVGDRLGRPVEVHVGQRVVSVVPSAAGIGLDVDGAIAAAYRTGRVAERLMPYVYSTNVTPPVVIASRTLPPALASETRAPVNASLTVSPGGATSVIPAVPGVAIDPGPALQEISRAALAGRPAVIAVRTLEPAVATSAATMAAAQSQVLVAAPLTLRAGHKVLGRLRPAQVAPLVRVAPGVTSIALSLDTAGVARLVGPLARHGETKPVDAHFRTKGRRVKIIGGRDGLKFDAAGTAQAIVAAGTVPGGSRIVQVAWLHVPPKFTSQDAKALGITKGLFKLPVTTLMGASSSNRIWNVHLLANILDGHIIQPGETFDFNKVVGQRTVARGFREGQEIVNGQLVPAIGGGVCQVATTLFDAAFYSGLKVTARTNHMFYLSHYPLGMDATVSWGGPELRFINTLHHAILLRMTYTNSTLSAQFYSTPEGITVQQRTGPVFGSLGGTATVTVFRTVRRNGKVIRRDAFTSHYIPEVKPAAPKANKKAAKAKAKKKKTKPKTVPPTN